jgi:UDP-glucose 4-epimerase
LAEQVQRTFGKRAEIIHLPSRNQVRDIYAKHDKALSIFSDAPQVDLGEGIERMARWAIKCGPMELQKFTGIELTRLLCFSVSYPNVIPLTPSRTLG